jgi:periplasmic divalent cation tolerance protein
VTSTTSSTVRIVLTTVAAEADGITIGRALIDERLAACVNVLPAMVSIYRWKGSIEQESERQIIIKTDAARLPALEARLRELHSYDVPEFLVLDVSGGGAAYLTWVADSVAPPGDLSGAAPVDQQPGPAASEGHPAEREPPKD